MDDSSARVRLTLREREKPVIRAIGFITGLPLVAALCGKLRMGDGLISTDPRQ